MAYVITESEAEYIGFKNPPRHVYGYVDQGKTKTKEFFSGVCEIGTGSKIPMHSHDNEEEIMFVYEGKGKIVIDNKEYQLEKGSMIFMPKGTGHKFVTDDEKLRFFWVFSPPGYENEIREKSEKEKV